MALGNSWLLILLLLCWPVRLCARRLSAKADARLIAVGELDAGRF
jgi:hypothetical protein